MDLTVAVNENCCPFVGNLVEPKSRGKGKEQREENTPGLFKI
jgi:hypothetical protein